MKRAIYSLSADPITNGHLNVVERALKVFDELIVGIGINPTKKYTFTLEERELLTREVLKPYGNRVIVRSFPGLLSDFAYENDIYTIIRGARNSADFDFEKLLNDINQNSVRGLDTLLYMTNQGLSHISSSAVKELVRNQAGDVLEYVDMVVKRALERRIAGQYLIGITGEIACGKTYVAEKMCDQYNCGPKPYGDIHNIDVDQIGHDILEKATEPFYAQTRRTLANTFGDDVLKPDGMVDTRALSKIIFKSSAAMADFDSIMVYPMKLMLRRRLLGLKGIIFINCALLAESDVAGIVNNDVVMITCPRHIQIEHMRARGYTNEIIEQRLAAQWTTDQKLKKLQLDIDSYGEGCLINFENDDEGLVGTLFDRIRKEILNHGIK